MIFIHKALFADSDWKYMFEFLITSHIQLIIRFPSYNESTYIILIKRNYINLEVKNKKEEINNLGIRHC